MKRLIAVFVVLVGLSFNLLPKSMWGWQEVQKQVDGSVVQILSQVIEFNWLEPYKKADQAEVRGSGFFINNDGDIITNSHVVDEAKDVWIRMPAFGKEKLPVSIKGVCSERDVALLTLTDVARDRIATKFKKIPFLKLGNSDVVRRTDRVLELGYPLGQYYLKSATGIVSGPEFLEGCGLIQITAPINAGNSGGPLLNIKGEVIGINTSKIESAENVGYAIPINELKLVLDELYAKPLLRKPMLGLLFNESENIQAQYLGNPVPGGVYIFKVFKNTIADKFGIKPGDMLYELNGRCFDSHGETDVKWRPDKVSASEMISRFKTGQKITAVIYRRGQRKELVFTWGHSPIYPIREIFTDYEAVEYEVLGGLVFMQLVDNHLPLLKLHVPYLVKYDKLENKTKPVLVITHIIPGSEAKRVNTLQPGDVIAEVNGECVNCLKDYRAALLKSVDTGFFTLKTANDIFIVLPFKKILEDEKKLSRDVIYPISKSVKRLMNVCEKKNNKGA